MNKILKSKNPIILLLVILLSGVSLSNVAYATDDDDIATAKGVIEAATYTSAQADASTDAAALTKAQALVNALEASGTTRVVVAGVFIAATAGDAGTPAGTPGSFTFTVTINKGGGTQATSTTETMAITATAYDATADNADIATAKGVIEAATYTSAQADASTDAAALTKAQALVNALEASGTTRVVVAGVFIAATAGDAGTPAGTPGSFTFTVTINKGGGTQATSTTETMAITATAYVAPAPSPATASSASFTPSTPQTALVLTTSATSVGWGLQVKLTVTGGSGTGAITYSSTGTTLCAVDSSGNLTPVSVGTCTVTANKAGDGTYGSAQSNSITITATNAIQPTVAATSVVSMVVGKPVGGVATVRFTVPSTNAGSRVSVVLGTKNSTGKIIYRTLGSATVTSTGVLTYKTRVKLPVGAVLQLRAPGSLILSRVIR